MEEILKKEHPIDIRFTIPLFWIRLYLVFLVGIDNRQVKKDVKIDRRRKTPLINIILFISVIFICVILGGVLFYLFVYVPNIPNIF